MTRDIPADNPYRITTADIEWRQGDIPFARGFDDIYFAGPEGLAESRYVFLDHNQLQLRWQQLADDDPHGSPSFTIAETGFGTGLNFLAAWALWRRSAPGNGRLHFISTEQYPLTAADLRRALQAWPELSDLAADLLAQYPPLIPGQHSLSFDDGRVCLHLLLGDANDSLEAVAGGAGLNQLRPSQWQVDAWFLDGFAPAKNPQLWNDRLYRTIARLSRVGATVATFTAVGEVRRGLERQGFSMRKVPGFGRKREMLRGSLARTASVADPSAAPGTPWYCPAASMPAKARRVAVIGAGLAGAHTARALAERGRQVLLLDAGDCVAAAASGNPAGMLYTRLSPQAGDLNQFTLSSYLFALRHYRRIQQRTDTPIFDPCGVLQLANSPRERDMLEQLAQRFDQHPQLVRFVDASAATELAGIPLAHPGWFFADAGWLQPARLCQWLAEHANIELRLNTRIADLRRDPAGSWSLLDDQGGTAAVADAVVLAGSHQAGALLAEDWLPLKVIRGQITQAPASTASRSLRTVVCHEGYLTPAIAGTHLLGATFDIHDHNTDLRSGDHQRNLDSLATAIPGLFNDVDVDQLSGRAALRCASPDYLPMAGPVPNYRRFIEDYAELRKNARAAIDVPGSYLPGLYLNIGHGSRGLTSTPLCAELIAATLCDEPPPVPVAMQRALNPGRFIIRNLMRSKI